MENQNFKQVGAFNLGTNELQKPVEKKPMEQALSRLDTEINSLEMDLEMLIKKISPIAIFNPRGEEKKGNEYTNSEMVNFINLLTNRLQDKRDYLKYITNSIEL